MADSWKPGDLAMLVRAANTNYNTVPEHRARGWKLGGLYVVEAVVAFYGYQSLVIEGRHSAHPTLGWDASCFRKVEPHAPDAEDAETIKLLNQPPYIGA